MTYGQAVNVRDGFWGDFDKKQKMRDNWRKPCLH